MAISQFIKLIRHEWGYSQTQCAQMCGVSLRGWQLWEAGSRKMPIASFELFLIKCHHHPVYEITSKSKDHEGKPFNMADYYRQVEAE